MDLFFVFFIRQTNPIFSHAFFLAVLVDDFDTAKVLLTTDTWIDRPHQDLMSERSYGKLLGTILRCWLLLFNWQIKDKIFSISLKNILGIIFSVGDGWREMRRFSTRTLRDFGFGKQNAMQTLMEDEANHLLSKMEEVANSPGKIINFKHLFTMSVLNILWGMISSVRTAEDDEKLKRLLIIVDTLTKENPMGGSVLDLFPKLRHVFPNMTGMAARRKLVREIQEYFEVWKNYFTVILLLSYLFYLYNSINLK